MTQQNPRPFLIPQVGAVLSSICMACLGLASHQTPAATPVIPQSVKDNLQRRVEYGHVTGVMVGMINRDGRAFFSAGTVRAGSDTPPSADTIFEIGSISKGFTGTLLAEMVLQNEVALDDPVQSHLPNTVTVPSGLKPISLLHLATHRSGLPNNPDNLCPGTFDAFGCFTPERLYAFLNGHTLAREPGAAWLYSNVGVGLLGHALAFEAGLGYEALLRERILDPLALSDTRVTLSAAQQSRRATGHWGVIPWGPFTMPALEGAGALHSTVNDLLTFLEHLSGLRTNVLGNIATEALRRRAAADSASQSMALGWLLFAAPGGELVYHDGATWGQNAFFGFHRSSRRGVVLLCNNRLSTYGGVQDAGLHLLDSALPLTSPRRPATVPPETLASYQGRYQSDAGASFDVSVRHGQLTLDFAPDFAPGFSAHAESATRFGVYEYGINGSAVFNLTGTNASLTWTQTGASLSFTRAAVLPSIDILRNEAQTHLRLNGTTGFTYEIHSSTDLRSWTKQRQHRPESGEFALPAALGQREFFQASFPPLE
jgi:D-alanyl-D-alanine-carboxypeptidase/D-alanyl-D-alanine-endopeptidase